MRIFNYFLVRKNLSGDIKNVPISRNEFQALTSHPVELASIYGDCFLFNKVGGSYTYSWCARKHLTLALHAWISDGFDNFVILNVNT